MLSSSDLLGPPPSTDTIYVSNLTKDITEAEIAEFFGQIGLIKKDKTTQKQKIFLYKNEQGELKGDGKVTYDDPYTAGSAVDWFHEKEFKGQKLHVSLAMKKDKETGGYIEPTRHTQFEDQPRYPYDDQGEGFRGGRGGRGGRRGGGRGGYGDRGGGYGDRDRGGGYGGGYDRDRGGGYGGRGGGGYGDRDRDRYGGGGGGRSDYGDRDRNRDGGGGRGRGGGRAGDWPCACGNINFGFRDACNKCHSPKPGGGGGGYGGGGGGYGGGGGGYGGGGGGYGGGGGGYGDRGGGYGDRGGGGHGGRGDRY